MKSAMPVCAILYDESHIWGILAFRALEALGIPCEPINSKKITQGALFRKPAYRCLLVPGGSARLKSLALGEKGRAEIKRWLQADGNYLGFCGGAGLALSGSSHSLGLCPWGRQTLEGHKEHALAGAILACLQDTKTVSLPVWWPGRFAPNQNAQEIVAAYHSQQGRSVQENFPVNQPLIIYGKTGKGRYLLSYAHLETPGWAEANSLLAALLKNRFDIAAKTETVPAWNVFTTPDSSNTPIHIELAEAWRQFYGLMKKGEELGLFFPRESWLFGWQPGVPGMPLAALLGMTHHLAERAPSYGKNAAWISWQNLFRPRLEKFCAQAGAWLESYPRKKFEPEFCGAQKNSIFGHPMRGGGLAGELLTMLEKIEPMDFRSSQAY